MIGSTNQAINLRAEKTRPWMSGATLDYQMALLALWVRGKVMAAKTAVGIQT